ncbi:MAG TPA: HigA family addiction module antitoxin [Alphaproteobacteria bacterium]|jgi:addiction module HigA family antidote|nr:HigA family addiction module antitoxin [Alphaproteobacteria bacterium]
MAGKKKKRREYLVKGKPAMPPTHPGALLREDVLPALKLSVSTAAKQLGVSRQTLHRIMAGEMAVSPDMAVRLGKFCGNGPGLWLLMQANYDLWHAERRLKKQIASIPTHTATV